MPTGAHLTRSAKDELARALVAAIREREMTQAEAAEVLGATQPDVSDLVRAKLDRFSLERLMRFAEALGLDVRLDAGAPAGGPSGRDAPRRVGGRGGDPVPEHLHRYFWDLDPLSLRLESDGEMIVGRLLETGGLDAVAWLRGTVGDDVIRTFLERRRGHGISPRRLRFWALVLGLPRDQVDLWVEAALRNPWERRARA